MITIWHNPRCSKSRQALELLRSRGIEPEIVDYLKTPPEPATIMDVLRKLGINARQMIRQGETAYRENGLAAERNERRLVEQMACNPILIERPVVISGDQAVIGRPPEAVLKLL